MHPEYGRKGQTSIPQESCPSSTSHVPAGVGTLSVSRTLRAYQIRYAFGSPTAYKSTNTLRTAHKSITFLRSPTVGPLLHRLTHTGRGSSRGNSKSDALALPLPYPSGIEYHPHFSTSKGTTTEPHTISCLMAL